MSSPASRAPLRRLVRLAACTVIAVLLGGGAARAAGERTPLSTLYSFDEAGRTQTEWQVKTTPDGRLVRQGRFLRFHPNGRRALVGYYRDGQPAGIWRWYDERGLLLRSAAQQGDYEEVLKGRTLPNDQTIFRSPKGVSIAEGLFKFDKAHGRWQYFYPDGSPRAEGRFVVGIPDGRWRFFYSNGEVERNEDYKLGVPHGAFLQGYPNGQERLAGEMDQGLRTGRWRTWFDNGQLESVGDFVEDRREGEWRFWSKDGRLIRHVRFVQGKAAEELPLPKVKEPPPPLIPHPETLPFRPRLYTESGGEIQGKPGY